MANNIYPISIDGSLDYEDHRTGPGAEMYHFRSYLSPIVVESTGCAALSANPVSLICTENEILALTLDTILDNTTIMNANRGLRYPSNGR